jgi:hypothetical protein
LALGLAAVLLGCSTQGLNFRQDRRVQILRPAHREIERLPVSVSWRTEGALPRAFDSFGVFVDRMPQPAGRRLDFLARHDRLCRRRPGCPDEAWFAGNGVYRTERPALQIASLLDTRPPGRTERAEAHTVTIVYLDGDGRRIGESAFSREFFLER